MALLNIKEFFFKENDELLANVIKVNNAYAKQPDRMNCKICDSQLGAADFTSFGASYTICDVCTHLNGVTEDTNEFVNQLYKEDGGENYSKAYLDDFDLRVSNIYLPKIDFLIDVLEDHRENTKFSVLDLGCGGGHFVKACELRGISARGIDPNSSLVKLGSQKLSKNAIQEILLTDFEHEIRESKHNVISMIGVLEHIQNPRKVLSAFKESSSEFLYLSVPMFSLSVFIENAFETVFPRVLAGGHTHLFTNDSLDHMMAEFGLETVGEWWFGTDVMDLFRSLIICNGKNNASPKFLNTLNNMLGVHIDNLQSELDQQKHCSEVHLVLRRKS